MAWPLPLAATGAAGAAGVDEATLIAAAGVAAGAAGAATSSTTGSSTGAGVVITSGF
jgi:hypothetical protein